MALQRLATRQATDRTGRYVDQVLMSDQYGERAEEYLNSKYKYDFFFHAPTSHFHRWFRALKWRQYMRPGVYAELIREDLIVPDLANPFVLASWYTDGRLEAEIKGYCEIDEDDFDAELEGL